MLKPEVREIIFEILEDIGISVPIEKKFDLSECSQKEKVKEFLKITQGDYRNSIYVVKPGSRDDSYYYDLLFCVNSDGDPICIPVPIARKLFNTPHIESTHCKGIIPGSIYEYIFKHHYEKPDESCELPF